MCCLPLGRRRDLAATQDRSKEMCSAIKRSKDKLEVEYRKIVNELNELKAALRQKILKKGGEKVEVISSKY